MRFLQNDRFIRALRRQPVDATPIWIMRQAGRYLPEYQQTRARAGSFMKLCKTPELACEVTLQPIARFALDAAIIFSDILTIPEAMGMELHFRDQEGPYFPNPIHNQADLLKLGQPDMETDLGYVMAAIRLVQKELAGKLPLIGFAGSPWTLAAYMIEGGGIKSFDKVKKILYAEPQLLHQLLDKLTLAVINYLNAQIAAGVDTVMIFDTWGGLLTPQAYEIFSLAYMAKIVAGINRNNNENHVPIILFTKGGGQWLELMADTHCDALGIDWTIDIGDARKRIGNRVALQGNLDPAALYAKPKQIQQHVKMLLKAYGGGTGHIFNLGHGISKDINPDHVAVLVDAVHELSKPYHKIM